MSDVGRALAFVVGFVVSGLWYLGSAIMLGWTRCLSAETSSFCAAHAEWLDTIEPALILTGTVVAFAGGVLTAITGRRRWLAGALALMLVLTLCAAVVLGVQEPVPG